MNLVVVILFTIIGGSLGGIVPQWHAWVGALIGFAIGVLITFGKGGSGLDDILDFD